MPQSRLFTVVEYSSFFAVRHNPSGDEHPMGDGVDTLFDDNGHALCPGTPGFIETWEHVLNADAESTLEAYFPQHMENCLMADVVVFRRWTDTGDIVAIFPEHPADDQGRYCLAHDELGQQIATEYEQVMQDTTLVSPPEYGRFAHELTLLGYDLQPITEASEQHHERRRAAARKS